VDNGKDRRVKVVKKKGGSNREREREREDERVLSVVAFILLSRNSFPPSFPPFSIICVRSLFFLDQNTYHR
jgi:hypothetical protein